MEDAAEDAATVPVEDAAEDTATVPVEVAADDTTNVPVQNAAEDTTNVTVQGAAEVTTNIPVQGAAEDTTNVPVQGAAEVTTNVPMQDAANTRGHATGNAVIAGVAAVARARQQAISKIFTSLTTTGYSEIEQTITSISTARYSDLEQSITSEREQTISSEITDGYSKIEHSITSIATLRSKYSIVSVPVDENNERKKNIIIASSFMAVGMYFVIFHPSNDLTLYLVVVSLIGTFIIVYITRRPPIETIDLPVSAIFMVLPS